MSTSWPDGKYERMTTVKIDEKNIFTVLTIGSLALLAVGTVAGLIFGSARFAGGVLAGGLLAIANFFWLRNILLRSLQLQVREAPRFAVLRYIVRLAVLALVVGVLIIYCRVDIFGLLLGLSVLVITIIALSLYMFSRQGD
jgi:ATP synthase I chain